MASNYGSLTTTYFTRRPKFVFMRKDKLFDLNFSEWFLTRLSWPGGMLVSSIFFSSFATRESFKGKVGCAGLLDTNANAKDCTLAIPSNDDSIDWVVFINDVFAEYILIKKLWAVLRWHYFLLRRIDRMTFFENWVSLQMCNSLNSVRRNFSKKFGKYSLYYFPLWFISSINSNYTPLVEKLNVFYPTININNTKKIFKNLFDQNLLKQKLIGVLSTISFFGRPLFYVMNVKYGNFYNESTLEMVPPHFFKYVLYNGWYLKKKFFSNMRKHDRFTFHHSVFITNIAFLYGFGLNFVLQRLALIFGNSFKYRTNWWETFFISGKWYSEYFDWWVSADRFRLLKSNYFGFFPGALESQHFFLWDPLEDDFKHTGLKYYFRHQGPFKKYKINALQYTGQKNYNFYYKGGPFSISYLV